MYPCRVERVKGYLAVDVRVLGVLRVSLGLVEGPGLSFRFRVKGKEG